MRSLRLARLACELDFEVDEETAAAAAASSYRLAEVAPERVFAELKRIMIADRALAGLEVMDAVGATDVVLPELTEMRGVEQSSYHHLDVYEHTRSVLASTIELSGRPEQWFGEHGEAVAQLLAEPLANELTRGQALRFGALLHDVAKPRTRRVTPEGRITFVGHDVVGAEVAVDVLTRLRVSDRLREHVAALTLRRSFLHPAVNLLRDSSARNRRKVALFQDDAVVYLMPRGHERQRAYGHFFLAGHPAPRPSGLRERTKKSHARAAHQSKLLGQARQGAFPERAVLHKIILFESRQWGLVAPRDAQSPVGEYPLRVRDVSENFFYRPLSRRIPEAAVSLAASREQLQHLQALRFQNAQYIVPRHLRNVVRVVIRIFGRFRPVHGDASLLKTRLYRQGQRQRTVKPVNAAPGSLAENVSFLLQERATAISAADSVCWEMFAGLWPGFDTAEVPIGSITNGVHAPTWVAREVSDLGDSADAASADAERLWGIRRQLRARLVTETRRRLRESWQQRGASGAELTWIDDVLDENVLTIGFARRVPSYKRLTLMLNDPQRLAGLLLDPERPDPDRDRGQGAPGRRGRQAAHPADGPGSPTRRPCGAGSSSCPTTTWRSPGSWSRAATSG